MLTLKQHGEPGRDCLVFRLVDLQGVVHYTSTDLRSIFAWLHSEAHREVRIQTKGKAQLVRLVGPNAPPRHYR